MSEPALLAKNTCCFFQCAFQAAVAVGKKKAKVCTRWWLALQLGTMWHHLLHRSLSLSLSQGSMKAP
jgi:hypothetical protein